jgi:Xaa-Pro aminopeptidase
MNDAARASLFQTDPQMWVPEERLYVRVEDTVAVTSDGIENLTGFVPLELDAIEALLREAAGAPAAPAR